MYAILPPDPIAEQQIAALPYDAAQYLAQALDLLEMAPWAGRPHNPDKPDGNMRDLTFGGSGLLTYLIVEHAREVCILRVTWLPDDWTLG
jgi:hypothetical protein